MYGGSLYDLAAEEGLDERILGELDGVTALLNGDAEYLHLLSIPSIPKKERCALLDEAFRGQVVQASAVHPCSLGHDASPTFLINSSIRS